MKITSLKWRPLFIPLKLPFKTALRTATFSENLLVEVYTDTGAIGYGSASPVTAVTGETKQTIIDAIEGPVKKGLLGMSVEDFDLLTRRLHAFLPRNTPARAAIDMALYDLLGKLQQKPVYSLLGVTSKKLITDITISLNEPDEMVRDSLNAIRQGFTILKIKLGSDPKRDVQRLKRIRAEVGKDVHLRVDANQGWTPEQAVSVICKLEDEGIEIELLEQPVRAQDLKGLKFVTDRVTIPIVADESAFSPQDVLQIIKMRGADMINLKLMKTGGINDALTICKMVEEAGMECMMGCMMESRVSVTAAAHLAYASSIITKVDLDAPLFFQEDPLEGGVLYLGEHILLSEEPGWGVKISGFKY